MQKPIIIVFFFIGFISNSIKGQVNSVAPTPPMGWMSWYPFVDKIDENKIMEVADAMVNSGLRDAGYTLLQLDDGWMASSRDKDGKQIADTVRFPRGMKFLADYVHSRGLKIGIYSSNGKQTCAGYPGSYNNEELDAKTYAEWGIDYLKYDACGDKEGHSDKELHTRMSIALKKTDHPILFEICIFSSGETHLWGAEIADMWRTGGDIVKWIDKNPEVTYQNWYENLNQVIGKESYAGNGHWNDPDNLIVDYPRNNKQTFEEQKAQFSLWSIIAAPLILGNDVRNMTPEARIILLNKEVIAINQDKAGKQGIRIKSDDQMEIWVKQLHDDNKAVVLFNKKESSAKLTVNFAEIDMSQKVKVRDLWECSDNGVFTDLYSANVASHGVVMIKLKNKN